MPARLRRREKPAVAPMMRPAASFWLLMACALSALAGGQATYPFLVTVERSGAGHQVLARNSGPAPVSVRLTLAKAENVSALPALPVYAVVRPHSNQILVQIRPLTAGRSHRFAVQSTYQLGSFYAVPDQQAVYRLPYENGRSFVVGQAPGGPLTTHNGPDSRYAVDFSMPENTPVVAARAGVVIAAESSYRLGGRDPALLSLANHVSILHADETVATYGHLAPGGVRVRLGERVVAGQHIGYSGTTGYTYGPHLHFVVQKLVRDNEGFASVAVPLRFYIGSPPHVFEAGYRQLLRADYSTPGEGPTLAKDRRLR